MTKLLVIINDAANHIVHNGYIAVNRRSVEIELTPEQEELLKLKEIGQSGATTLYETIESVTLTGL